MRKFIRTLILLLMLAAIIPFVLPWKDGKPMLSWQDVRIPDIPDISLPVIDQEEAVEVRNETGEAIKLYRWRDGDGSIQFGDTPPPEGVVYEMVEVYPDANLIQAIPLPKSPENKEHKTTAQSETSSSLLPSPLSVSPEEALELVKEAKRIREISEQRLEQTESLAH